MQEESGQWERRIIQYTQSLRGTARTKDLCSRKASFLTHPPLSLQQEVAASPL